MYFSLRHNSKKKKTILRTQVIGVLVGVIVSLFYQAPVQKPSDRSRRHDRPKRIERGREREKEREKKRIMSRNEPKLIRFRVGCYADGPARRVFEN